MTRPPILALLYALLASTALLLLAPAMPPFQNADELAHADRADQISHAGLLARRLPDGQVGGMTDSGLAIIAARTAGMPFHPQVKLSRTMSAPTPWGGTEPTGFPNTAIYPPLFYGPAALTAAAARTLGVELPQALVLMRIATGSATILIAASAIAMAAEAAIWLFTIMLLPMSLGLTASVSQDGPMLASVAFAVALSLHLRNASETRKRALFAALCISLAVCAMARPPYLAFSLLILAVPVSTAWRARGLAAILGATSAWMAIIAENNLLVSGPDAAISPSRQAIVLATHPWRLPVLIVHTAEQHGGFLLQSFIGILGWLDVPLPHFFYPIAWTALGIAALTVWRQGQGLPNPFHAAVIVMAAAGASIGLALTEYLTWTPVGAPNISGLQGRYFLPCALVLGACLARGSSSDARGTLWLTGMLIGVSAISIAVTMHAILLRYYL